MKKTLHLKELKRKEWILLTKWQKTLHLKEIKRKEWILLTKWYQTLRIDGNQTKRMNSLNILIWKTQNWWKPNEKNEFF